LYSETINEGAWQNNPQKHAVDLSNKSKEGIHKDKSHREHPIAFLVEDFLTKNVYGSGDDDGQYIWEASIVTS